MERMKGRRQVTGESKASQVHAIIMWVFLCCNSNIVLIFYYSKAIKVQIMQRLRKKVVVDF